MPPLPLLLLLSEEKEEGEVEEKSDRRSGEQIAAVGFLRETSALAVAASIVRRLDLLGGLPLLSTRRIQVRGEQAHCFVFRRCELRNLQSQETREKNEKNQPVAPVAVVASLHRRSAPLAASV